ncbi:RING/U-box superfamily protein [Euphorbia peplus]|nr:RING/U-box superfamily protein [Euphorbia peplus]
MGISSFPSAAEGVLPVLVMNTILSVALFKNTVRSLLQIMGANWNFQDFEEDPVAQIQKETRISVSKFKNLHFPVTGPADCRICLSGYGDEEEVSEVMDCKHCFHKGCLDKWFDKHTTCPLCRSIVV